MLEAYNPLNFFSVAFRVSGSAVPTSLPRAFAWMLITALPSYLLARFEVVTDFTVSNDMLENFSTLVALLIAFRLSDAYSKYQLASRTVHDLHASSVAVLTKLSAFAGSSEEAQAALLRVRRLMVFSCVLVVNHVRGAIGALESQFVSHGLITQAEADLFKAQATINPSDGKAGSFPPRFRPALAFLLLQNELAAMLKNGHINDEVYGHVDGVLSAHSAAFEQIEFLGSTILPLPYAQITRLVTLVFLAAAPFANAQRYDWMVFPASLTTNVIYFTIEHCAALMETPFGSHAQGIDLCVATRRIDEHTAAILSVASRKASPTFDLFPESGGEHGQERSTFGRMRSGRQMNRCKTTSLYTMNSSSKFQQSTSPWSKTRVIASGVASWSATPTAASARIEPSKTDTVEDIRQY